MSCRYIDGKPVKIGAIHVGKSQFGIWYFFYRRLPDFEGGSAHGNTRLYIFKNGRFLGEYDPPQPHKMHIQGNTIVIDDNEEPGNTITLTAAGPPKRVLIDGDFLDFTPR
jgi:hypothetical protein